MVTHPSLPSISETFPSSPSGTPYPWSTPSPWEPPFDVLISCVLDSSKATDVRRFVPAPAFSVLSRYLEVELLIHMEIQRLAIWTLARLFPTAAVWVLAPLAAHRNSIFSMSPPTPFLCLYFVLHEDVLMGGKWCGVQFDDGIADGHP